MFPSDEEFEKFLAISKKAGASEEELNNLIRLFIGISDSSGSVTDIPAISPLT